MQLKSKIILSNWVLKMVVHPARGTYNLSGNVKSNIKPAKESTEQQGGGEASTAKDEALQKELDVDEKVNKKKAFPGDFVKFLNTTLKLTSELSEKTCTSFEYTENSHKAFATVWTSMKNSAKEIKLSKDRQTENDKIRVLKLENEDAAELSPQE